MPPHRSHQTDMQEVTMLFIILSTSAVKSDQAFGCLLTMCNSAWPEGVDDSGNCATALHKA